MGNNDPKKTDSTNPEVEKRVTFLEKDRERLRSSHIDRTFKLIQFVIGILGSLVAIAGVVFGFSVYFQWAKFTEQRKEIEQLLEQARKGVGEIEYYRNKAKNLVAESGETEPDETPQKTREEVKLLAPNFLKREKEGETLTADMHYVLGMDAYNKGDMEEAARRWGIAAREGNSAGAYYNWGNALYELAVRKEVEELFQEAFDKYAKAIDIKPNYHEAYSNWGLALSFLAWMKGDEESFRKSFGKFAEAVRIEPEYHEAYSNWGSALYGLAEMKKEEKEKEALFRESFTKFAGAISIKPDLHEVYTNWAVALRAYAKIVKDENKRESFLRRAEVREKKAEEIKKRK